MSCPAGSSKEAPDGDGLTRGARAVIFDVDGVIVDSAQPHLVSWKRLAAEEGLRITDEQFAATFGRPSREIIRLLFGHERPDAEIRRLDDRKEAIYRDLIRGSVPAMPGAVELIRRLGEFGLRLAIGSSGPPANVELVVDELRIRAYFGALVTGEDVSHGKPDPEVFLLAAERLSVRPAECVVIEDAPAGIEAAHRGGMAAVGLAVVHPAGKLTAAELVVSSLRQLRPEQIMALSRRCG